MFLLAAACALAQTARRSSPQNPHGPIKIPCENCHTTTAWAPIRAVPEFSHNVETRFPLRGLHENVPCVACHTNKVFTSVGKQCADCHADIHRRQFGAKCEECHTVRGWRVAIQSVKQHMNRFPLLGAHAAVQCESCHTGAASGVFTGLSTECYSCHLRDFNQGKPLDHRASNLPTNCTQCHSVDSWSHARFDHTQFARFALTGMHTKLDCAACHAGGRFQGTPADCFSCHSREFQQTSQPNHPAAGFPTDCSRCHTTNSWAGGVFDHNTQTKFALAGAHMKVTCNTCHTGGRFAGTPMNCSGCHMNDFQAAANPDHKRGNFSLQCETCHTVAEWKGAKFDHNLARFNLTGAHISVTCTQCHVGGKYTGTPQDCFSCHQAVFKSAQTPNHVTAGFPTNCVLCHTTSQWKGGTFDHNTSTRFALTGAHSAVNCQSCHGDGRFTGTPADCASCHLKDFQKTSAPNHAAAKFATDCVSCHTTTQWKGAKFDHGATKFALSGAHMQVACMQCHTGNRFAGIGTACVGCHLKSFQDSRKPKHTAAGFPQDCTLCHTTQQWIGGKFDHNTATKFALTGKHATITCIQCHAGDVYTGTSPACIGCHTPDFQGAKNPNHVAAQFPQDCAVCHTTVQWTGAKFDHNATKFPLTGKHAATTCAQCHVNGQYQTLATQCVSCHLPDFQKATNPNHVAAQFPQDCAVCHTTVQWTGAKFDHSTTKFPLTGKHASVVCATCHVNGVFKGLPGQCVDCHRTDYQNSKNPNHATAGFPTDCVLCHTTIQWQGAKFDHNATKFPLSGKHTSVVCAQCHVNGVFKGLPGQCVDCHRNDYKNSKNPNHVSANLPLNCEICHSTAQWQGAVFDHNKTSFPLNGKHTLASCAQCHVGGVFKGLPAKCVDCHKADFQNSKNPNHVAAGFPTDCALCHTTAQWQGAKFDHNTTKFPLTGKHMSVNCTQCHANGVFKGLPGQCVDCHRNDYQNSKNPNHTAAGFPTDCALCHTTVQWQGAKFDHNTATKFPLAGKHTTVACTQCHVNGVFKGLPSKCFDCHRADYQNSKNPSHVAAGFPTDCGVCHTTVQWQGAKFDHNTATKFPLAGKHTTVSCTQCHVNGVFKGLPSQCVDCHRADYQNSKSPNHTAAGFPTDCAVCHTTVQWQGAKFDHNTATKFPLSGKHTTVACTQCHANGVFKGLPSKCVDCHRTDYQNSKNPNHTAAGFPTDCSLCHTTVQWQGAKFDHNTATKFPLAGKHVTVACAQCHVNGVFKGLPSQCVDCHRADFQNSKNPSHVSAGFPTDCSLCHATVQWQGAKFDHNTATKFPLVGKHATLVCNQCHSNGKYAGTPANCVSCHLPEYQKTTNPNHVSAGFPQDCSLCHTSTQWPGAKFDHTANTKFPLTGKHTSATCVQCHANGVYKGLPTACVGCHLADFKGAMSPPHAASGFPQDCSLCHVTAQWTGAKFDHTANTTFPLTGKHTTVTCAQCHSNGVYKGLATACVNCHLPVYQKTTNPNHVSAGFPQDCSLCHTTTQWPGAKFDHTAQTTFPLTGKHTTSTCSQCHSSGVYKGLSTACVNCHLPEYQKTSSPNHVSAGFPKDCSLCHSTTQWPGAKFDHTTNTTFPLTGKHVGVTCAQCHSSGVYKGLSTACVSCHLADFKGAMSPPHVASGFPQDCALCHTTAQWPGAKFDHTTQTTFPLTGKHTTATCSQCHASGVFKGLPKNCVSCHLPEYQKTTSPNHASAAFPQDCSLCHTTTQWPGAKFDHTASTTFPLTGFHTTLTCAQCHSSGVYKGLSVACYSCHQAKYQATTNPKHTAAGFPQDCSLCHTTKDWTGAVFNHTTQTTFPLTGFHMTVTCVQCHSSGVYKGLSTACVNCHLADFKGAMSPPHVASGFPQDCSVCHTTTQWMGAKFDHTTQTTFPLTGFHTTVACAQCHSSGVYKGLSMACYSCHQAKYQATTNPNHVGAGFPQDCSLCHTTKDWSGAVFNHTTQTTFPLTGKHTSATCQQCHSSGVYKGLSMACYGCHAADYKGAMSPPHAASGFPQDCSVCHTTTQWPGATFNHTTMTTFPLTGKHTTATCQQCHSSGVYKGLSVACYSCHAADFKGAMVPPHVASGFPQDCSVCHTTTQWPGAKFDHTTQTTFPLTGFHTTLACAQCHSSGVYKGLSMACYSCHQAKYQATTNPNHTGAAFPQDCSLCHTTKDWTGAVFNHTTQTTFPLTGKHTSVTCIQCHSKGVYKGLSMACYSCHQADFTGAMSPPHVASGFPQDCSVCHTTTQWPGASFNHTTMTTFPLTGKHTSVACTQCHSSGVFKGLSTACYSCHKTDFTGAMSPPHVASGFPQDCSVCHTTTQWPGASFNHTTMTTFPLTGKHTSVTCAQCHSSGVYKGLSMACYSCHAADYKGAMSPPHAASGLPQDCSICHTTTQWPGAKFDHTANTTFPLTGFHTTLTCSQCHSSGVYKGLSTACYSCHQATYQATTNPKHAAAGFPQDCSLCHTTKDWTGATFDHTKNTTFPLTGYHTTLTCLQCHSSGVYKGLSTACYSCHSALYATANAPNHAGLGYPQDCSICHNTTQWMGATFNHSTWFVLSGVHATTACSACHVGGKFPGTPTDCYSCHNKEYNATTNPNHKAAGFPTTCTTCHTGFTNWLGATFNHTWFPIYSGSHQGKWTVCADCHTNSANYTVFLCTGCHTNAATTPKHSQVKGYVWNSTNCYACHPKGTS